MALAGVINEQRRTSPFAASLVDASSKIYAAAKDRQTSVDSKDKLIASAFTKMLPNLASNPTMLAQTVNHPDFRSQVYPALQRNGLGWLVYQNPDGSWGVNYQRLEKEKNNTVGNALVQALAAQYPNYKTDPVQAQTFAAELAKASAQSKIAEAEGKADIVSPSVTAGRESKIMTALQDLQGESETEASQDPQVEMFGSALRTGRYQGESIDPTDPGVRSAYSELKKAASEKIYGRKRKQYEQQLQEAKGLTQLLQNGGE